MKERFKLKYNLDENLVNNLVKSKYLSLFERMSKKHDPKLVSSTTVVILPSLERDGINVSDFSEDQFSAIFDLVESQKIAKEAIPLILTKWSKNTNMNLDEVLGDLNLDKASNDVLEEFIDKLILQKKDFISEKKETAIAPLMGLVMKEFRGKISGKIINELLAKKLGAYLSG